MKTVVRDFLLAEFGDASIADEIYAEYRSSTQPSIDAAARALDARDFVQLDRVAHALKGNALMVGDPDALAAALALRDAAKARDHVAATAALGQVRDVFAAG